MKILKNKDDIKVYLNNNNYIVRKEYKIPITYHEYIYNIINYINFYNKLSSQQQKLFIKYYDFYIKEINNNNLQSFNTLNLVSNNNRILLKIIKDNKIISSNIMNNYKLLESYQLNDALYIYSKMENK
jgi:hypothetical protein